MLTDNISSRKSRSPYLCTLLFLCLIGMRLGDVFFYSWDYYQNHLLEIFLPIKESANSTIFGFIKGWKFTGFTGFASHGAAIGIPIALYFYAKKHLQKPWLFILDRLAIVVALAGFFIRFGNFFNSEIYGKETGSSFGVIFKAAGETSARHPTQLYEAISYLALFLVMWFLYSKTNKKKSSWLSFWVIYVCFMVSAFLYRIYKRATSSKKGRRMVF